MGGGRFFFGLVTPDVSARPPVGLVPALCGGGGSDFTFALKLTGRAPSAAGCRLPADGGRIAAGILGTAALALIPSTLRLDL